MAQPNTPQPPAQPPSPPVHPAGRSAQQRRWLIACLLLLIAASAVGIFLRYARSSSSSGTLQGEACPAPGETAAVSCPLPQGSAATPEPFPAQAEAQVDWVLRYQQPAMILFYSNLCRPCMMMDALVQMVRRDYEPAVTFIAVVGDNPANAALVHRMGVGSVPASFFLTPAGESKRVIGLMKQQDLRAELARLAALAPALLPTPTGTASP
jgi:thiol:disulfide interchange protein